MQELEGWWSNPGSRTCTARTPGRLQHRGSLRLTGCHYLSSKCWFGWKKETSIFWKVPFLLFCELCVALPAGAVQTQKFLLFFFCLNTGRIKVDSKGTDLQNCQIHVKPTTWQTPGDSCSYGTCHGMLLKVRLLILTALAKIQRALLFSASFKLFSALSITCWSFLHLLA